VYAAASARVVAEERRRHLQEVVGRDERDLAQLEERRERLQIERTRWESEARSSRTALEAVERSLREAEEALQRLQRDLAERAAALAAHEADAQALVSKHEAVQTRVADLRAAEAAAGAEVERARSAGDRLSAQLAMIAEGLGLEVSALAEGEEFLVSATRHPLWATLQGLDDEALERRLAGAQRDLRGVGGADYGALADYATLRDRYAYLSEQLEDLAQTEARVREGMAEVRERIRDQFRRAFDQVNDRFKDAFRDLFGGGDAELILTAEPDDPQCGIDVVAQPPGKRQHRMATLSGGERSLIGGALLLSLVAANPSPFCMFDEVDAALDETNVQRFISAVREMARETQFILVTHNRATMEMADALYGVTMSPSAVSQIVGIRLPAE
jgi:chromosome segregation protein